MVPRWKRKKCELSRVVSSRVELQLVIRRGLGRFQTVTSGHEAVGTLCKLFTGATPETDPGACLNAPRLANGGIYLYISPFFPTPIYPSPCRPNPIYLCASSCWPKQRLPHSSRNTRQRPPTTHPRLTPADAPFQTS
ncbi:unnamed protein product [Boreogadus saida]